VARIVNNPSHDLSDLDNPSPHFKLFKTYALIDGNKKQMRAKKPCDDIDACHEDVAFCVHLWEKTSRVSN